VNIHAVPIGAYSVKQFCEAHGNISKAHFYVMKKRGEGPQTFKSGSKVLISTEAAAKWRAEREAAEQQKQAETFEDTVRTRSGRQ
jgi:hypothetical protein